MTKSFQIIAICLSFQVNSFIFSINFQISKFWRALHFGTRSQIVSYVVYECEPTKNRAWLHSDDNQLNMLIVQINENAIGIIRLNIRYWFGSLRTSAHSPMILEYVRLRCTVEVLFTTLFENLHVVCCCFSFKAWLHIFNLLDIEYAKIDIFLRYLSTFTYVIQVQCIMAKVKHTRKIHWVSISAFVCISSWVFSFHWPIVSFRC